MATAKNEPKFSKMVAELSAADALARSTSADASQARADRSNTAVTTIKAAFAEKIDPNEVREKLIDAGVLKGTVSKIVTILNALNDKIIKPGEITSLNGAYVSVKEAQKALAGAGTPPATPAATPAPPFAATTPDDALEIILDAIRSAGDEDAVFRAAGDWITRITNEISTLTKTVGEEDE